jgi:hypothetical protein
VCARRLQEAGELGQEYVPAKKRIAMIMRQVSEDLLAAEDGDLQGAAEAARRQLGRFLDQLPSAEDAVDHFMSASVCLPACLQASVAASAATPWPPACQSSVRHAAASHQRTVQRPLGSTCIP